MEKKKRRNFIIRLYGKREGGEWWNLPEEWNSERKDTTKKRRK